MAEYDGKTQVADKVLVANTTDTVTFEKDHNEIEVYSDGTAVLTFRVDGTDPVTNDPRGYSLPAQASTRTVRVPTAGNTKVKLISSGTPTYTVTVIS